MAQLLRSIPPLPSTERGTFCSLSSDKTGERILYCSGSNVVWRPTASLTEGGEKAEEVFCWKGHVKNTTCAAMSPNGQWVVSGDVTGAVRLWGAKGEHAQKNEYKLWDGTVKDVGWSDDSGRLVACGDGKEVRAVAMIWDTGSKTGEVAGHTKQVNSISFRSQRPFKIATGGEDMLVAFHQGPPFKFVRSHSTHSNFVNSVRFSPDGEWLISAGSDAKLCLYTGKDGEFLKEFQKPAGLTGSFWSVVWSPDSSQLATAGGDKKVRIWDRESGVQVAEGSIGSGLQDMQVGLTWATAARLISVALDGRLICWDGALKVEGVVDGTQGPLNCLSSDLTTGNLIYGGTQGTVAVTPPSGPTLKATVGKGIQHVITHSKGYSGAPEACVISLDDCIRRLDLTSGALSAPMELKEFVVGAGWLDVSETMLFLVTGKKNFHCVSDKEVLWTKPAATERRATSMAVIPGSPGKLAVALEQPGGYVGGVASNEFDIVFFEVQDTTADGLVEKAVLRKHLAEVSTMKFSPSGEFLATGDAANKIFIWSLASGTPMIHLSEWGFHTARIACLEWLPGGRKLVSGSLDRHLFLWDVDAPEKRIQVKEAHKGGVTSVAACGESSFASVGHDGFVLVHGA